MRSDNCYGRHALVRAVHRDHRPEAWPPSAPQGECPLCPWPSVSFSVRWQLAVTSVEQWDAVESARKRGKCVTWLLAGLGPKPGYPTEMSFILEELQGDGVTTWVPSTNRQGSPVIVPPTGRDSYTCTGIGSQIFVVAGWDEYRWGVDDGGNPPVEVYDIISGKWNMVPPFGTAASLKSFKSATFRYHHTCTAVGSALFVVGGQDSDNRLFTLRDGRASVYLNARY